MFTAKPSNCSFNSPAACPKQSSTRIVPSYNSCTADCFQEKLTFCLTCVEISQKERQPPYVEYLWMPSRAKPSAISFPQTFTCDGTH
ncbi:hypothetical protein TNCV_4513381 [Trichonephila clavipes]|nr:hypothetical protein TNCV_4513381 [Trichonephila clavipes]